MDYIPHGADQRASNTIIFHALSPFCLSLFEKIKYSSDSTDVMNSNSKLLYENIHSP